MASTESNKKYYRKYTAKKKQMNRDWYLKNRESVRAVQNEKRRKAKIEKAGYAPSGKCEICEKEAQMYFDHDHKTNDFRGWLCFQCNTAIGLAQDDVRVLARMIQYLEERRREMPQSVLVVEREIIK